MKKEQKILTAFLLNLFFSVFEFFGGLFTGSVAILSDALHDLGDSVSIGVSYFLERKSKKKPDSHHTYGYIRYSLLGSFLTTVILLSGSVVVSVSAVERIFNPTPINYNGMIIFAVIGFLVNTLAAFFTHGGHSLNTKAVNLHMLEDSLGWAVVLIGATVMRFTDLYIIDPLLSLALSIFIFINAAKNLKEILDVFLEKTPKSICPEHLTEHLKKIEGVVDIHHLHIRSLDGFRHEATLHIVVEGDAAAIKKAVREELLEHGVVHSSIETEYIGEDCGEMECGAYRAEAHSHHHGHHHHHHH